MLGLRIIYHDARGPRITDQRFGEAGCILRIAASSHVEDGVVIQQVIRTPPRHFDAASANIPNHIVMGVESIGYHSTGRGFGQTQPSTAQPGSARVLSGICAFVKPVRGIAAAHPVVVDVDAAGRGAAVYVNH